MAKRYFDYEKLNSLPVGEVKKPGGTMGSHHFVIESKDSNGISIIGYTSNGSKQQVFLPAGWTLMYDRGFVRKVRPADKIKNPLMKEFRLRKWPSDRLKRSDEPIQLTYPITSYLLGQGWEYIEDGDLHPFNNIYREERDYVKGEVFLEFVERGNCLDGYVRRLYRVVVRSSVSDERAAHLIQSWERMQERQPPLVVGDLVNAECVNYVNNLEYELGISRLCLEKFFQQFPKEHPFSDVLKEISVLTTEVVVEIGGSVPQKRLHKTKVLVYRDQYHFHDEGRFVIIPYTVRTAPDTNNRFVVQGSYRGVS